MKPVERVVTVTLPPVEKPLPVPPAELRRKPERAPMLPTD
jgi:hypothetical protein